MIEIERPDVDHGGQPGHADAWADDHADRITGGIFSGTRATTEQAFLRPRVPGYPAFQAAAGLLLHACLVKNLTPRRTMGSIADLWRRSARGS